MSRLVSLHGLLPTSITHNAADGQRKVVHLVFSSNIMLHSIHDD